MITPRWFPMSMALLGWIAYGSVAAAQTGSLINPKPISNVGGVSGQVLDRVYRNDIGRGYSVGSLNYMTLQQGQASVPYVGQSSTRSGTATFGLDIGPSGSGKPFESFSASPTTSPYLNLFREDLSGFSDMNYQTLVRPQLQQQQFNQGVQRQSLETSQRLRAAAAQGAYNPQGAQDQFPTGHRTLFGYLSHFYPSPRRRSR